MILQKAPWPPVRVYSSTAVPSGSLPKLDLVILVDMRLKRFSWNGSFQKHPRSCCERVPAPPPLQDGAIQCNRVQFGATAVVRKALIISRRLCRPAEALLCCHFHISFPAPSRRLVIA